MSRCTAYLSGGVDNERFPARFVLGSALSLLNLHKATAERLHR